MWNIDIETLSKFFPEIEHYAKKCQSPDCNHIQEYECAVKKAVRELHIRKDRYESYISLQRNTKAHERKGVEIKKNDIKDGSPTSIEEELRRKFKVHIKENQKILNIEHNMVKLSLKEKTACIELICKLPYIEILDLSKNGTIFLSEKINDLPNLKKLRIDDNALNSQRDKEFMAKLIEKGIKVMVYSV